MNPYRIEDLYQRNMHMNTVVKRQDSHSNEFSTFSFVKRLMDIVLVLIGLVLAFPIVLVTALAIKLESEGPIFYKQERVGKNGKNFIMYKLRSMYIDAEKNGPKWADKDDDRVTNVGKFIRRTRIDELPQLWNVLKGDMSIIGPRPERPNFTMMFERQIPGFVNRLQVKPGLTGWAQVNGGYELSPAEKLKYDMEYINNLSLVRELEILFKTIAVVIKGDGAR